MSKDTAKWVGLSEIIYQYIDQARMSNADYRRLWAIGVRGVEEMGMDVYATPKTAKLVVNANKTVTLPSDYIAFSKVGVFNADGEVATLRRNINFLTASLDCLKSLVLIILMIVCSIESRKPWIKALRSSSVINFMIVPKFRISF